MIAAITSILGFLSAGIPHLLDYFKSRQDNTHELEMLRLHAELAQIERDGKIEALGLQTDAEMFAKQVDLAIAAAKPTGIRWVDALNASVRPVLAYAFFILYATVKVAQWYALGDQPLPWAIQGLWSDEDQAIFAGIICFYFGQRAFRKAGKA